MRRAVLILAARQKGEVRAQQALRRAQAAGASRNTTERERCGLAPPMSDAGGNVILMTAERRNHRVGGSQKVCAIQGSEPPGPLPSINVLFS